MDNDDDGIKQVEKFENRKIKVVGDGLGIIGGLRMDLQKFASNEIDIKNKKNSFVAISWYGYGSIRIDSIRISRPVLERNEVDFL